MSKEKFPDYIYVLFVSSGLFGSTGPMFFFKLEDIPPGYMGDKVGVYKLDCCAKFSVTKELKDYD